MIIEERDGMRTLVTSSGEVDVVEVNGIAVAADLFEFFADDAFRGAIFRLVARDGNTVTLQSFPPGSEVIEPK